MREIEVDQGFARACNYDKCRISLSEAVSSRQIDVSEAFSLCWRTMWMLDMARRTCSKSNTIQTQEDITQAGKIAGNTRPKLYMFL